jgi:hypothetical protein
MNKVQKSWLHGKYAAFLCKYLNKYRYMVIFFYHIVHLNEQKWVDLFLIRIYNECNVLKREQKGGGFILKKKFLMITIATILIVLATGGTIAYFTKEFSSENNTITAATFDVDVVNSGGTTIGDEEITLDQKLYPGMETIELYNFRINKNNTEVPVKYSVNVTPSGDLFPADGSSPVVITLQQEVGGEWANVGLHTEFKPQNDIEKFRILVDWPHSDNDIDFQSLLGNIGLVVNATQIDDEDAGEDPEDPEGPPYYTGEVKFKATPNGSTRTTSNKEVSFSLVGNGLKTIQISMGDGQGEFEDKVGNIRIVESVENGTTWYRVYTDNEYYASGTQLWRTSNVDTSVDGVITFNKVLGPFLSIQSKALYDWFTTN